MEQRLLYRLILHILKHLTLLLLQLGLIILFTVGLPLALLVEQGDVEGTKCDDCCCEDDVDGLLVVINLLKDQVALFITDVQYAKLVR